MSKIFMGNPCGYGNCMSTECKRCSHYKPTFFGMRVPKWLGNLLFKVGFLLQERGVFNGRF